MAFSVTTTYTRTDSSVQWWEGSGNPEVLSLIVNNYIYPKKILSENVEFVGLNVKKFTRIFDTQQSWEELTAELTAMGNRAERNNYCNSNNITISVSTQEVTLPE